MCWLPFWCIAASRYKKIHYKKWVVTSKSRVALGVAKDKSIVFKAAIGYPLASQLHLFIDKIVPSFRQDLSLCTASDKHEDEKELPLTWLMSAFSLLPLIHKQGKGKEQKSNQTIFYCATRICNLIMCLSLAGIIFYGYVFCCFVFFFLLCL